LSTLFSFAPYGEFKEKFQLFPEALKTRVNEKIMMLPNDCTLQCPWNAQPVIQVQLALQKTETWRPFFRRPMHSVPGV
jgi:hypothetical protein